MATNRLIVQEQIATYAKLLFEAALNDGGSDGVLLTCIQGKQIAAAIHGNAEFDAALKDPGYTAVQKAELIRGVFADASPALVNTLAVMAERGEVDYLGRIMEQFEARMADELDIVIVEVESAIQLDDHLRDLIKKKAETELGKKAVLSERVNESLLGGIIMSTRGERIDASLLTQIEKIRDALQS